MEHISDALREEADHWPAGVSSAPPMRNGNAPRPTSRGFSGAHLDRPALQRLLADIEVGHIDCVAIYKVDRLSRSLFDFADAAYWLRASATAHE
jgi:hypothetical protein